MLGFVCHPQEDSFVLRLFAPLVMPVNPQDPQALTLTNSMHTTCCRRILRWARGSGSSVIDVQLMLEEYKRLAKVFSSKCAWSWGGRERLQSVIRGAGWISVVLQAGLVPYTWHEIYCKECVGTTPPPVCMASKVHGHPL